MYRFLCVILLAALLPSSRAFSQQPGLTNEDITKTIARISAIPRQHQWSLLSPQDRRFLESLVRITREQRDRLIGSSNALERGIGIFVAEQQGDVGFLFSLSYLLDDKETTLPHALPTAAIGQYARADQAVAEYLTAVYKDWFGVDVNKSRARFGKILGQVTHPLELVQPWVVRLRRAHGDDVLTAEIKKQIELQREETRWAVITLGYLESRYSRDEAHEYLVRLSLRTQGLILQRADELLSEEPLFTVVGGPEAKATVLEECSRLLQ